MYVIYLEKGLAHSKHYVSIVLIHNHLGQNFLKYLAIIFCFTHESPFTKHIDAELLC